MAARKSVSRETSAPELDEHEQQALDELGELAGPLQGADLTAAAAAAAAAGEPVVLEFGRYRVFQAPDGGWVIARAVGTCDRCQECGCGSQADPIMIPAMVIRLATMQGGGLRDKIKAIRAGVNGGD